MNKRQIEVEKAKLAAEEKQLRHLKAIYKKAADDIAKKIEISNGKISVLLANWDELSDEQKSVYQSQIYQRDFQKSLQKQLNAFLKDLNSEQYKSVDEYLKDCYTTGYIGTLYDIAGQGIPLVIPIDQKQVIKAMTHDTKLSEKLYTRLGEDVTLLKKRVANNISRGIATADSYANIARNIANGTKININRTMTIARTEGHRIQVHAADDAQHKAKAAGADVVKQWDAALDGRTRPHHRQLDGQIRELDEPFEVAGMKVMYPSGFGVAAEDINCRCALLQRARCALDEAELDTLKERAAYYGLDKTKDFEDFRKKYLKISEKDEVLTNRRKQRLAARAARLSGATTDDTAELKKLNKNATDTLLSAYEKRRLKFNLNETPAADLKKSALNPVTADYTGVSLKTAKAFNDVLTDLMEEYYSGLTKIRVASKKEMFGAPIFAATIHKDMVAQKELILNPHKVGDYEKFVDKIKELQKSGHAVKVKEGMEDRYIATHEFAHSLLDMKSPLKNHVGLDTKPIKKCRKEINKLYDEYMFEIERLENDIAAVKKNPAFTDFSKSDEELFQAFRELDDAQKKLKDTRISKYSLKNSDEFLAEAFTEAKIGNPNEYSLKVLEIIDKYFKDINGLGTKNNRPLDIPEHKKPEIIKKVDFNDKSAVKSVIDGFERSAIKENAETACVITKSGMVYKCFGITDRVFIDSDLGDELKGSKVSHNHPIEETSYSFSDDDLRLFLQYELEILRGCDEKYTYEFMRNADDVDTEPLNWMTEENYQHTRIITRAKEYNIGYRRWKNDQSGSE